MFQRILYYYQVECQSGCPVPIIWRAGIRGMHHVRYISTDLVVDQQEGVKDLEGLGGRPDLHKIYPPFFLTPWDSIGCEVGY